MNKQLFKLSTFFTFSLILPIFFNTNCMLRPKKAYNGRRDTPIKHTYHFKTAFIHGCQKIKCFGFFMLYKIFYKKENAHLPIEHINNKLKEFESWLLQEEQAIIITLKNKFNMDDQTWNLCLADITELKNIYKQALQNPHPDTTYDANTHSTIINTVHPLMTKNNIHPQSISLHVMDNDKDKTNVSYSIPYSINQSDNSITIKKSYNPITFHILPPLMEHIDNQAFITAVCAHEIQHIVQLHSITRAIIEIYLCHYCAIDETLLTHDPDFQKFIQIQEAQADLLAAIDSPESAAGLNEYRKEKYYPHYLYEKHYHNITTIDMLWQLKKLLA